MKSNLSNVLIGSAALGAMMMAVPAMAQDAPVDEIIATGIRASLERGQDVKRQADVVVDAISAEELGKFPDQNVAESLQRITGVAITRSRGGEGQFVTVRGLGQEFNTLTYKGRELATENPGREFSFDVVPSELINAAQVYKTTTASQTDGSIGGLVNIETARALDNPGFHGAGSIGTQLEGLNDDFGFKGSAVLSNTFADDTIGIIGSIAYQQRDFRTDTAESIAIDNSQDCRSGVCEPQFIPNPNFDPTMEEGPNNPSMIPNPAFVDFTRLNSFNANLNEESRERLGGTLAVEFEPNDDTSVTLDFLYTNFQSPSLSTSYSYFPNPGVVSGAVVDGNNDVLTQTSNFNAGAPFSNIFDFVARRAEVDTETFQIGGNWEQRLSDDLSIELDASYSNSDGVRDGLGTNDGGGSFFVVSFVGAEFAQTSNGAGVPDVNFTALPNFNALDTVSLDQLPADGARLHFSRNSSNRVEDEIFTIRGDADWDFDDNAKISAGFDFITRSKANQLFDNSDGGRFCGDATVALPNLGTGFSDPNGDPQNAFICDRSIEFADLLTADQLSNLLVPFNGESEGFLGATSANIPRNFQTVNIGTVEQAFDALAGLTGQPSFLSPTLNEPSSSDITENVISGYLQTDFEGQFGSIPFQANAGVRLSYTDLQSRGVGAVLQSIVIDTVSGNNAITVDPSAQLDVSNDYFDVLPSFNIAFDVSDNFVARGGFSRSLARPTFNDLTTVFAVTQINAGQEEAAGSNPLLEAVRSNNVDLSLEYYGDSGLTLTAAGFYKDISDFITNANTTQTFVIPESTDLQGAPLGEQSVDFLVTGPQNGDSAEVYGLELAGQYLHDSGFGVASNVTLADSNATSGGAASALENISDFSANVSVFYENHGLQARAALNHRGEFLSSTEGEGGFAEFTDDFTQLDLSVSYSVEEWFGHDVSIFAEGINVTNEPFFNFSQNESFLETFIDNGSRWLFGVRGSF